MPYSNMHLGDKDCASRREDRQKVQHVVTLLDAFSPADYPSIRGRAARGRDTLIPVEDERLPIGLASLKGAFLPEKTRLHTYPRAFLWAHSSARTEHLASNQNVGSSNLPASV